MDGNLNALPPNSRVLVVLENDPVPGTPEYNLLLTGHAVPQSFYRACIDALPVANAVNFGYPQQEVVGIAELMRNRRLLEPGVHVYNAGVNIHQADHVDLSHLQQQPPMLVFQGIQYVPLTHPQVALPPRPLLNVQYQVNGPQSLRPQSGAGNVRMAAPRPQQAPAVRETQIANSGPATPQANTTVPQVNAAAAHAVAVAPQAVAAAGPKAEIADATNGCASSQAKDAATITPEHRDPAATSNDDGAAVDDGNTDHTATERKQRQVRNDNKYNKIPLPSSFSDGVPSRLGDVYTRDPNPFAGLAKLAKMWKTHKDETYNNNMFEGLPHNYCAYRKTRTGQGRSDVSIWGHPSGKAYMLIPEFFPHFSNLMEKENTEGCTCKLCDGALRAA